MVKGALDAGTRGFGSQQAPVVYSHEPWSVKIREPYPFSPDFSSQSFSRTTISVHPVDLRGAHILVLGINHASLAGGDIKYQLPMLRPNRTKALYKRLHSVLGFV